MVLRAALLRLGAAALVLYGAGAGVAAGAAAPTAPVCRRSDAAAPALARLREALAHGRFAAYQPTSLTAVNGTVTTADPASIRADLEVLRPRFDALVTYDAVHGAENIAPLASALGFRALIVGVWNPRDERELGAALDAARQYPDLVAGVALGNETLFSGRSDASALLAAFERLRAQRPQLPLSISEPFHIYYRRGMAALLGQLDFLLPNVHPVFQPWFHDASQRTAAQFVVNVVAQLARSFCGPILVKETGVPTAPPEQGFSAARQAGFYLELRRAFIAGPERAFAYFSAFDAPWRAYDATPAAGAAAEAHWGLYDAQRRAKQAARELPPLSARRAH